MHELSLCLNIIKILERQKKLKTFKFLKKIELEIGMLACVEKEALLFSFPIAAKNTLAENTQLNIIDVPGRAKCLPCQMIVDIHTFSDVCPHCGQFGLQVMSGTELRIRDIEVI